MNFEDFFFRATKVAPYGFQRQLAEAPLPELLQAGTGSGKTAAAVMAWLWKRSANPRETPRRLVIVQPMRTLVEQTRQVIDDWLDNLELEGSDRPCVEILMGGEIDLEWEERPEHQQIIVGTQDQILSRALMRGYAMSRYKWPIHFAWLHEDTLWVLDEVQLMGPGLSTSAQLQAFRDDPALQGYRPAKSLWMSATLDPRLLDTVDHHGAERTILRVDPKQEGGQLLERSSATKHLARCDVALTGTKRDELSSYIEHLGQTVKNAHEEDSLTLIILNRVSRAQQLARWLHANDVDAALLHSRFRPVEREDLRQKVLSGAWTGVLVATQAVEAGVDISAKVLLTELAPWSSLVQRFGRCNRYAEQPEGGQILWIDLPDDEAAAAPYSTLELQRARELLGQHADAAPTSLDAGLPDEARPVEPVLRRKDLLELFDTTPDLTGMDLDVSRFIRATDERDIHVAWWDWPKDQPPPDQKMQRDELCRVPAHQLREFVRKQKVDAYQWDYERDRSAASNWKREVHFTPGITVVMRCESGGYSDRYGWTGSKDDTPSQVPIESQVMSEPNEADGDDPLTTVCGYVGLTTHLTDTRREMVRLVESLNSTEYPKAELVEAAHWHDVGKAHPCFQEAVSKDADGVTVRELGLLAKSPKLHRYKRRHFRHELASALAVLQTDDSKDLVAYLVAAHHGKVRMSIRARPGEQPPRDQAETFVALGVYDGDTLPAVDLGEDIHLEALTLQLRPYTQLGGSKGIRSWRERSENLLAQLGPFRLAYLESLVRIADWRASEFRNRPEIEQR